MASLNEPDFRSFAPSARYAAPMGTTVGLSQTPNTGLTQELPQGMLHKPESKSSMLADPAPSQAGGTREVSAAGSAPPPQRIPRWLVRMEMFLRVMLRMYIGLAICYAPWSHTFWDQNPVFAQFPGLAAYAGSGAVRGIISGLGLLNLWFAFHDALRHRDG